MPVAVAVMTVSLLLWQALVAQQNASVVAATEQHVEGVQRSITVQMGARLRTLKHLADRWSRQGGMPREEWDAEAQAYVDDYPGLQALEWVDPSYHVRWIVPFEGNEAAQDLDLGIEDRRLRALQKARDHRDMTISRSIDLVQGGKGFLVYLPLFVGERFDGFLLGVFRTQETFASILEERTESGYHISILDGDEEIFVRRSTASSSHDESWYQTREVALNEEPWQVRVAPGPSVFTEKHSSLPTMTLLIGCVVALLLGLMLHFARTAREGAERFRTLFEGVPVGLYRSAPDGTILAVNPKAARLANSDPAALVGTKSDQFYFDEADRAARLAKFEASDDVTNESEMPRADGSTVWMREVIHAVRDEAGDILRFEASIEDITERKLAEAALARKREELERSNKELDEFAYVASHDLKEPLRGIHNYASFLLEDYGDKLDEEGIEMLETLPRLTKRLESLINSLLQFSRVGRVDLAVKETDLNTVVTDVLDTVHISLEEQNVDVRIPKPLPTLACDQARIGEVFRNLVTNALKYNDKDEKWIEIGWGESDAGREPQSSSPAHVTHHTAAFYVRDNGIGIPEKNINSVFGIFNRLHEQDEYGGGTGIGLTIVKKIIEKHGGEIWAESVYGDGTTFHFTLPERAAA